MERQSPYCIQSDKFSLNKVVKNYSNQFNQLYNQRLIKVRELIKRQVRKTWGEEVKILDKIIDSEISEQDNHSDSEYVMIGTIYKQMDSRNSVMLQFSFLFIALLIVSSTRYLMSSKSPIYHQQKS